MRWGRKKNMGFRLGEIRSDKAFYVSMAPFDFFKRLACLTHHGRTNVRRMGLQADIGVTIHAFYCNIILQVNEKLGDEFLVARCTKANRISHAIALLPRHYGRSQGANKAYRPVPAPIPVQV